MELYNNGDKVIIRSTRGMGWNPRGEMDQYCGKTLTIKKSGFGLYVMEECPEWFFDDDDIVGLVE